MSINDFNLKELADLLRKNLPPYGVPVFLRLKSELKTTATFKLKKVKLKKEGFDIKTTDDSIYVMLPEESEYTPLEAEIYEDIQNQKYKFCVIYLKLLNLSLSLNSVKLMFGRFFFYTM